MTAAVGYASVPLSGCGVLTAADVSRTAPATTIDLVAPTATAVGVAAAPQGAFIERVTVTPLATVTATVVRLFRFDPSGGGKYFHLRDIVVPAQTVSGLVAVVQSRIEAVDQPAEIPIILPAGWSLRATIQTAQTGVEVCVEGGGF